MQGLGREQPTVGADPFVQVFRAHALRQEPAQVSVMDHTRHATDAALLGSHPGPQHALGGEQRHLRVVGDCAAAAIGGSVVAHASEPEALADLG